jgi:hypothetical protein
MHENFEKSDALPKEQEPDAKLNLSREAFGEISKENLVTTYAPGHSPTEEQIRDRVAIMRKLANDGCVGRTMQTRGGTISLPGVVCRVPPYYRP